MYGACNDDHLTKEAVMPIYGDTFNNVYIFIFHYQFK